MRINERDILDVLRNGEDDSGEGLLEQGLEKVASAENVLRKHGVSLEDLDDDEALEVVAQAGLDQEEAEAVMEFLANALEEEDVDEDVEEDVDEDEDVEDDDGTEKEASLQHMYESGYVYALGFGDGMTEVEKTAAKKMKPVDKELSELKAERLTKQKDLRSNKAKYSGRSRWLGFEKGERARDALRGLFSSEGVAKMKAGELKEAPFLARLVRKGLGAKGGRSGKLSKTKAGMVGGGLLAALGAGGYGISRAAKRKNK